MCDVWADQNDATLDGYNGKARRTDGAFPAKKGPPTMQYEFGNSNSVYLPCISKRYHTSTTAMIVLIKIISSVSPTPDPPPK